MRAVKHVLAAAACLGIIAAAIALSRPHAGRQARRQQILNAYANLPRTFVDPARSGRVGLIVEVPSMAAFDEAMRAPRAEHVRTESFVILTER